jgi:hypothetical protein
VVPPVTDVRGPHQGEARAIERVRDLSRALIADWHRVDPELKRLAESSPEWSALSEQVDQLLDEHRRLIEETRGGSSAESWARV